MVVADFTAVETSEDLRGVFRSHSERVELALLDKIRENARLVSWCDGRIDRLAAADVTPEGPFPQIGVCAQELSYELAPSGEIEVLVPIRVRFFYDEDREVLRDEDRRAGSFAEYLILDLFRERTGTKLMGTRYGERSVVDRLYQLGPTQIGDALRKEDVAQILEALEAGEAPEVEPSGRSLDVDIVFAYTITRSTFAPVGFDPTED